MLRLLGTVLRDPLRGFLGVLVLRDRLRASLGVLEGF